MLDRPRRQPALAVGEPDHVAASRAALIGDEPQHVAGGHVDRADAREREEHQQVEARGQHRVRAAPRRDEPQVRIDEVMAEADLDPGLAETITLHHRNEHGHGRPPPPDRRPRGIASGSRNRSPAYQSVLRSESTKAERFALMAALVAPTSR